MDNIVINPQDANTATYDLKLADLASIQDKNAKFPFTYTIKLHVRERLGDQQVETLGTGVLTIPNYLPKSLIPVKTSTISLPSPISDTKPKVPRKPTATITTTDQP
jgi:hypothetical protein